MLSKMPVIQRNETIRSDTMNTNSEGGMTVGQPGGRDSPTRPSEQLFSRVFRTVRLGVPILPTYIHII